jgi:nucleolar protein 16
MQRRFSKRCPVSTQYLQYSYSSRSFCHKPALRAPKLLQDAWDRHLTVKQKYVVLSPDLSLSVSYRRITAPAPSYTALGLLPSLNPRAKGGAETVPDVTLLPKFAPPAANTAGVSSVPKGHGRIIRDEHGNVLDVQLSEDDRDEEMGESQRDKEDETPWGATMEDWGNEGKAMPKIEGKTEVIKGALSLSDTP